MKSGALWAYCLRLALADFRRDPLSSESWRARPSFVLFLSGKQRTILPIFRRPSLNIARLSVRRWILSEQNFENFPVRGPFFQKRKKSIFFNALRLQATITPHIIDRRKFITSTGYLVSNFTVGINSKLFPWPVHSVQETSQKFLRRRTRINNTADNADISQSQPRRQPVTIDYWVTWQYLHRMQK